eukprot:scaffold467911_cov36-Prasinocladus_malaysianus.AAC.1
MEVLRLLARSFGLRTGHPFPNPPAALPEPLCSAIFLRSAFDSSVTEASEDSVGWRWVAGSVALTTTKGCLWR